MPIIAVLENPIYVINIGHVMRNICALGITKLYVVDQLKRLDDDPEALKKRKSLLKHSSGAAQFIDVRRFDTSKDCLDKLSKDGFVSIATSPEAKGKKHALLHESDLTPTNLAIWFGNEANGLTDETLERCESCISIEMDGNVESFNLGTTTGIVLYEAFRQRKKA
jgi:tRNA (guanosine-2'-O-)-methyltransferase